MNEDNCPTCGARPRHQRNIERRCAASDCDRFFDVLSDQSIKRYCSRRCQINSYRSEPSTASDVWRESETSQRRP